MVEEWSESGLKVLNVMPGEAAKYCKEQEEKQRIERLEQQLEQAKFELKRERKAVGKLIDELKAEQEAQHRFARETQEKINCQARENEEIKFYASKVLEENRNLEKLTDPDRISVDYKLWQETQEKLKKVGWLLRWL